MRKPNLSRVRSAAGRAGAKSRWGDGPRATACVRAYPRDAAELRRRATAEGCKPADVVARLLSPRTIDLYAAHPESVPPEYAKMEICDASGARLKIGDYVRLERLGVCRIAGRRGAWIDLDQGGEPAVAFVTELREGVAVGQKL